MNDLFLNIGLLALAISHLSAVLALAKLQREVSEVLTFVRAFLDSIHVCADADSDQEVPGYEG